MPSINRRKPGRARLLAHVKHVLVVGSILIASCITFFGVWKAVRDGSNRIEDWLPRGFQESQELQWFRDHFGGDSFLMISWEGCEIAREATQSPSTMARFAELLRQTSLAKGMPAFFSQVITGDDALELLAGKAVGISRDKAIRRLEGWMVGRDGKTSCIVVVLSEAGLEYNREAVQAVYDTALRVADPALRVVEDLHVAGPAIEALEIERSSHRFLLPLNVACYVVCAVLMKVTFRSVAVTCVILVNAIASQLLFLASVGYSPWCKLDSVMLIAPSLMFVLTVSGAVHLVNYYRDVVKTVGHQRAAWETLRAAAAPTLFAALTTAVGLLSLVISMLVPVRNFGIHSAIGVMLGLFLLATLPWQLSVMVPTTWSLRRNELRSRLPSDEAVADVVAKHYGKILAVTCGVFVIGTTGSLQLQAMIRIHDFFLPQSKLVSDYEWLQQKIGPLSPIEIVAKVPQGAHLPLLDQLQVVARIQNIVAASPGVSATASAVNFSPPLPSLKKTSPRGIARQTIVNRHLNEIQAGLIDVGFLRAAADQFLWRISARAFSKDEVDYAALIGHLKLEIAKQTPQFDDCGVRDVDVIITGGVPVLQKAQDQMLADLISSFVCSMLFIMGSMIVLFGVWAAAGGGFTCGLEPSGDSHKMSKWRHIARATTAFGACSAAGLVAMIPNILPVVVVFGGIGAIGLKVGVGSMLTATVAMGIAIDDTLHFLTWYHRSRKLGRSRQQAVALAFTHCATAVMQTSAIFVFGMAVFMLSPYLPTARYAGIMSSMLFIALIGDLVVLPALLLSPVGWVFDFGIAHREPSENPQPATSP